MTQAILRIPARPRAQSAVLTTRLSPETAPFSPPSLQEKLRLNKVNEFVLFRKAERKRRRFK